MPSYKWVLHKGKRILYADIASQKTEELLDIIARVKVEIEKEPPGSVLAVCDVKGGRQNTEMNQTLKEFTKEIDPYVKMIAIVGLEGLQTIVFNGLLMFTRTKKVTSKSSEQEAFDYLAGL
jgi:hypothetical protein